MTAEPSCYVATYTKQIQKFRFWGGLLCSCKLESSIIWISLPREKGKQVWTAIKKGKSERGIWSNVYTTCYHKGCELSSSKMLRVSVI